ncbi:CPXV053 protein, partial [Monkeypox virus]
YKTESFFTIN